MEEKDSGKLRRARKRVEELKGFYVHFAVYIMVNIFISTTKIVHNLGDGEGFGESFWNFGTFAVWLIWGIGIFFHGLKVFSRNIFFGKDWEERQIRKYMEREKEEAGKYR